MPSAVSSSAAGKIERQEGLKGEVMWTSRRSLTHHSGPGPDIRVGITFVRLSHLDRVVRGILSVPYPDIFTWI
jgi:hypothetical protein